MVLENRVPTNTWRQHVYGKPQIKSSSNQQCITITSSSSARVFTLNTPRSSSVLSNWPWEQWSSGYNNLIQVVEVANERKRTPHIHTTVPKSIQTIVSTSSHYLFKDIIQVNSNPETEKNKNKNRRTIYSNKGVRRVGIHFSRYLTIYNLLMINKPSSMFLVYIQLYWLALFMLQKIDIHHRICSIFHEVTVLYSRCYCLFTSWRHCVDLKILNKHITFPRPSVLRLQNQTKILFNSFYTFPFRILN